jgi:hypothetical protein
MNAYPLAPFLTALAADGLQITIGEYARISLALQAGGAWTAARLRDTLLALLAKDEGQQEVMRRRFDEFFAPDVGGEGPHTPIDVQRALADLREMAHAQPAPSPPSPGPWSAPEPVEEEPARESRFRFKWWRAVAGVLLVGMLGALLRLVIVNPDVTPAPAPSATWTVEQTGTYSSTSTLTPTGTSTSTPTLTPTPTPPLPGPEDPWKLYAAMAAFGLLGALLYGLLLWRRHRGPADQAPEWDRAGPRHFSLGAIGGQPAPRLDDETLGQLADSMGYFQSEESGRTLNVEASIEATLRSGGIPTLEFYSRARIRSLLVLEDAYAEATTWNPVARELAEGMARRGVPVTYGRFDGCPDRFRTEDGSMVHLVDLED